MVFTSALQCNLQRDGMVPPDLGSPSPKPSWQWCRDVTRRKNCLAGGIYGIGEQTCCLCRNNAHIVFFRKHEQIVPQIVLPSPPAGNTALLKGVVTTLTVSFLHNIVSIPASAVCLKLSQRNDERYFGWGFIENKTWMLLFTLSGLLCVHSVRSAREEGPLGLQCSLGIIVLNDK